MTNWKADPKVQALYANLMLGDGPGSTADRVDWLCDRVAAVAASGSPPSPDEVAKLREELRLQKGANAADAERLAAAELKVFGENVHGCDAADWMAEEVLSLRASSGSTGFTITKAESEALIALEGDL